MEIMFINTGLAFLEGFALIVSPCILPILPIILSGSLEGGKRHPIGIIFGFVIAFALFTFFSKKIVQLLGIDLNIVRNTSFILLFLFGIIMVSDYLTEKFGQLTQGLANVGSNLSSTNNAQGGFLSGLCFGGLVGLVWTPCAGPILAAVILQTVIQKTNFISFLTVLSFGIGAALPMLIIVLFGRSIMEKINFIRKRTRLIRKILGVIIIAGVVVMYYGSSFTLTFSRFEDNMEQGSHLINGLSNPYPAPPIEGIEAWINSKPLQLNQLKGKVILIDFWAYSCINCVRTLPYLKDWYKKYHDKGLVIIGVHSPEFDFESVLNNVKDAAQKYGIQYPIALDNKFVTWRNFRNHYWPAHYLIDKNNNVVYEHFGEGEYGITENNIRYLLGINTPIKKTAYSEKYLSRQTPETYLGYARADQFNSPESIEKDKGKSYTYPHNLLENEWALNGVWLIGPEKITALEANSAIKIHFYAGKVFAVMGNSTNKPVMVTLKLNGEPLTIEKGKDVKNDMVKVTNHELYSLIDLKTPSSGVLELIATEPGLEIYTFTFGD